MALPTSLEIASQFVPEEEKFSAIDFATWLMSKCFDKNGMFLVEHWDKLTDRCKAISNSLASRNKTYGQHMLLVGILAGISGAISAAAEHQD